jgi:hypothetical protein
VTDLAHTGLLGLAGSIFTALEDHLFDAANNADDHIRQGLLLDATRKIRLNRQKILGALSEQISGSHRKLVSDTKQSGTGTRKNLASAKIDELALQSDGEAAVAAAKSMIVNGARVRFKEEINTLSASVAALKEDNGAVESFNPLDAGMVVDALASALSDLKLSSVALICVLEQFNDILLKELVEIYRECLGCLEDLNVAIVRGSPEDERGSSSSETSLVELRKKLSSSPAISNDTGSSGTVAAGGSRGAPAAHPIDRLSIAQSEYLKLIQQPNELVKSRWPNLGAFLMAIPAAQGGFGDANTEQQDILKIVSVLFEQIFDDDDISLAAKNLIARLQFPILTVAIADSSFFDDVEHPAREFLNILARDGMGWPSSVPLLKRHRAFQIAEALVQRIIDGLPSEVVAFSEALRLWGDATTKQYARVESAERRISEAAVGQARLEAARRIVQRQINRAAGLTLPSILVEFIRDRLLQLMVLICIKHGTDSGEWREILEAFVSLTQACGRKVDETWSSREIRMTLEPIKRGIERFGCIEQGDSAMFARMASAIERNVKAIQAGTSDSDLHDSTEMKPVQVVDGKVTMKHVERAPILDDIVPGTWLEFERSGAVGALRCRLVVYVDRTQTYVFADEKGLKAHESHASELLEGMESGQIRRLSEEPLVDRAIVGLMRTLDSEGSDNADLQAS